MTTIRSTQPTTASGDVLARVAWFVLWAFLTVLAWYEVVQQGYVRGDAVDAVVLTATAVGAFILPDLTFLVGLGQPVRQGYLPTRAVPFYNALHRIWPPLVLTAVVAVTVDRADPIGAVVFVAGLSWLAHVAMDRAAGYGLRNADGSR